MATGSPQSVKIAAASSGDNSIVAADATHRIVVIAYDLVATAAVNVKWRDGTTDLTGPMTLAAAGSRVNAPMVPQTEGNTAGYFKTSKNAALQLNLSGAVEVDGFVTYVLEPA